MTKTKVDVLSVMGANRLETSQFARMAGVSVDVARRSLRKAEAAGLVEIAGSSDGTYWRRGAALPLIWRARAGGAA